MTNTVETVRELTVTNTVTVTNVVTVRVEPEVPPLSARKTAPYLVSSGVLRGAQLRKLLSEAGVRVITCDPGAVALVEAPERAVAPLRAGGVVSVFPLGADDKIAADAGERVRIVPLSSIDVAPLVAAVRALGGELIEAADSGQPVVRAKLSYTAIRKLAGRGDVRKIERDGK